MERTERFFVRKLYTWVNNKSAFHTATVYKDGKEYGTMALSDANKYCEKWNGRPGNFEVKK